MKATLFIALFGVAHGALELTPDTYDAAVEGKSAFIKFLAPW